MTAEHRHRIPASVQHDGLSLRSSRSSAPCEPRLRITSGPPAATPPHVTSARSQGTPARALERQRSYAPGGVGKPRARRGRPTRLGAGALGAHDRKCARVIAAFSACRSHVSSSTTTRTTLRERTQRPRATTMSRRRNGCAAMTLRLPPTPAVRMRRDAERRGMRDDLRCDRISGTRRERRARLRRCERDQIVSVCAPRSVETASERHAIGQLVSAPNAARFRFHSTRRHLRSRSSANLT